MMYVPEFPTLSPAHLIGKQGAHVENPFPLNQQNAVYFFLARNGIYHLFKQKRNTDRDTVLVPDYHHGNEIRAILAAGWKVKYYHIGWDLAVSVDELEELMNEDIKAVLAIHYIGWPQQLEELRQFCDKHGLWLFEDCALSFLAKMNGKFVGGIGDYSVFCLYKSLPVPNGAVLAGKNLGPLLSQASIISPGRLSTFARSIQLWIDWLRLQTGKQLGYLDRIKETIGNLLNHLRLERTAVGDSGFDELAANLGISSFSQKILPKFDFSKIYEYRRRNFRRLRELLHGKAPRALNSLSNGACPLFFPILVKDKSLFVKRMRDRGIGAVPFWNQGHATVRGHEGEACRFLRRHLAEIPVHQDLEEEHLQYMASVINAELDLLFVTNEPQK